MPLSFAAIVPHPPILIPSIGKEAGLDQIQNTKAAMERLETELYAAHIKTIIIISPHESIHDDSFVVHASDTFTSSFEAFGDMSAASSWTGAPALAARISHAAREASVPVRMMSKSEVSHGTTVPLRYLTKHADDISVLPVGFSGLSAEKHIQFGELLKDCIMSSSSRIAVIASGDLARCHSADGPIPHSDIGAAFDVQILQAMAHRQLDEMLSIGNDVLEASHECGYRSFLILMGIIKDMDYTLEQYSYEHPFGVGYVVAKCTL
jgi:MEMO1 family protein